MTEKKITNNKKGFVHLSATVSPEVKKSLIEFANSTKRTTSQATFHLVETHPEMIEFQKQQKQTVEK